ncbi:MAG: Unknown protein [uncultured Thiotrichaceae bacterium]|uniref:Uncharacterized protein n=1 Tax=uncultured Thiotrichaceae bacterium TaxID=298394 RepID=A0A6S6U5N1_9GAMM|nr:MAG: Unknown protein [uncultured Thiotrichaceae bacterium]
MSDLPLIYELGLVATLIALIAWFMGRTLCESKEHEVRATNQSLEIEKQHLVSRLAEKDTEINNLSDQLKDKQKQLVDVNYQCEMDAAVLSTLKKEQKEALNTVQTLTPYRIQYEQLTLHHEAQSKQMMDLKKATEQNQDEIQHYLELLAKHDKERDELTCTKQKLTEEKVRLEEAINKQNQEAQKLKNDHIKKVDQLQTSYLKEENLTKQLQQDNKDLHKINQLKTQEIHALNAVQTQRDELEATGNNLQAIIIQLKKENAELQELNSNLTEQKDVLNERINSLLQSTNSNNIKLSSMLEAFP